MTLTRRHFLAGAVAGAALAARPAGASPMPSAAMIERSVVSQGHVARLTRVFAKAERGEAVTLGFIGGSITQGGITSRYENCYVARVAAWWTTRFPKSPLSVINAGIGGTGSLFGSFRVGADLLAHDPDLVVVDFAVNDAWSDADSFEGLLRQILSHPTAPATLLLFMMWDKGGNCQSTQVPIGRHYGLPMISFRDAVWPEISAGRLAWHDIIVDTVHPNDLGHQWTAQFCTAFFEAISRQSGGTDAAPMPAPLRPARYQHVRWLPAKELAPDIADGWQIAYPDDGAPVMQLFRKTARLQIDWTGKGLALVLNRASAELLSHTLISIDGQEIRPMDKTDFIDRETVVIATDLPDGKHRLRLQSRDVPLAPPFGLRGLGLFVA